MSRVVFVLGAGASKEAGVPVMNDFLDSAESLNYATRDPDFDAVFEALVELRAANAICKINLRNIESVFSAFEIARRLGRLGRLPQEKLDALPDQMRRLILKTIQKTMKFSLPPNSHYPDAPIPYGKFAKVLEELIDHNVRLHKPRTGQVAVLTFNYDLGVDYALLRSPLSYDYCFQDDSCDVPLLKLHGSLNWRQCECGVVSPILLDDFFRTRSWRGDNAASIDVRVPICERFSDFPHCADKTCTPLIVPPTWSKGEHHALISPIWRRAAKELSEANTIVICGYSLPDTDVFFHHLLGVSTIGVPHLKKVWVLDPAPAVRERYTRFLGEHALERFSFSELKFNEAIEEMRRSFFQSS